MPSASKVRTKCSSRSDCSMRHPLGNVTFELRIGPVRMFGPGNPCNQVAREGPHVERHLEPFRWRFVPKNGSHLIAHDFVAERPRRLSTLLVKHGEVL